MRILLLLALLVSSVVHAAPLFETTLRNGEFVVLTDEPCTFPPISNILPLRATWTEKGKVFEGCYIKRPDEGDAFLAFPEDLSTIVIPLDAFKRVSAV